MDSTAEVLTVVRTVLTELAAEEDERARCGDPLALPAPLTGGVALAAVTRLASALAPETGVPMPADPSDLAIVRRAIGVTHDLLLVRRGLPDEVELATLIEDLARDAARQVWPSGEHEHAVARGALTGLTTVLDSVAPQVEPIRELRPAALRINRGLPIAWAVPAPAGTAVVSRTYGRMPTLVRAAMASGVAVVGVGVLYAGGSHTGTSAGSQSGAHVRNVSCEKSASNDEPFHTSPTHLIHLVF